MNPYTHPEVHRAILRRCVLQFAVAVALVVGAACALPSSFQGRSTAQLSTPGIVALHSMEVIKVLDVLRDVGIDGEAAHIISVEDSKKVVLAHRSILLAVQQAPNGWKETGLKTLELLQKELSPAGLTRLDPYIAAARNLIKAVL